MKKLILILILIFLGLNCNQNIFAQKQGKAKIDSLLTELSKVKEDTIKINILNDLSFGYFAINPDEGIKYGLLGLKLSEEHQWKMGIAISTKNLGVCYWSKSNYSKALEYFYKSLRIFEEIGNKSGIARNMGNIGIIYLEQNDYTKALENFFKALKLNKELGDKSALAKDYGNIGIAYRNQNNDSEALKYNFKALNIQKNLNDKRGVSNTLGNIGNIYANQSDYPKALEYYFNALNIFEELDDKRGIAMNLGNIGGLYVRLSKDTIFSKIKEGTNFIGSTKVINLESGIKYSLQAIRICEEIGDLTGLFEFSKNVYDAYKSLGNYPKALEFHELYQKTKDSVFNLEKTQQLLTLDAEREDQLHAKEIEVLNKEKQNQLIIRNYLIVLSIIGVFVTLLILYFYQSKKKDNKLLETQNTQIQNANLLLEEHEMDLKRYSEQLEEMVRERTRELEYAKEKAEVCDRLKTAFLSNMSHEIRTPMIGIIGFSKILSESNLSKSERKEYAEEMNRSSNRLLNLLNDIIFASQLETGNIEIENNKFNLNYLIEEIYSNNLDLCNKKKIELNVSIGLSDDESEISTDEEKIQKILSILLDNSLKFTDSGSITFGYQIIKDNFEFFIKDTGCGISEDFIPRAFEIFAQEDIALNRLYEGAGLGLPIAKGLVELLGGRIWTDSKKGTGTTMYFTLPKESNNNS